MKAKILTLVFLFASILSLTTLFACQGERKPGFGIYLVDTGELVISEKHIRAYFKDSHNIELNSEGIEQWNSFLSYTDIPKLVKSLYQKNFVVKVKDEEIYQGKFYSMISSASYDGVVILDAIMKLDGAKNSIQIDFGYPSSGFAQGDDPRNNLKIMNYLESKGLLR